MAKRKVKISFTYAELDALHQTAGQMQDDMEYYNFLPKKYYKIFLKAYETAMDKLLEAKSQLPRPKSDTD